MICYECLYYQPCREVEFADGDRGVVFDKCTKGHWRGTGKILQPGEPPDPFQCCKDFCQAFQDVDDDGPTGPMFLAADLSQLTPRDKGCDHDGQ